MSNDRRRLVVVSHACVLAVNQSVFAELSRSGLDVLLVVPSRWKDEFTPHGYVAEVASGLEGRVHTTHVLLGGRPQRYSSATRSTAMLRHLRAELVLIEEEPFSVAAMQWARAARRAGVPFGVQVAETKDRRFPAPVRRWRSEVLRSASFVIARSPAAADLARAWGATGEVTVLTHDVEVVPERPVPTGPFTIVYLGRLVEEKGVADLLDAFASLGGDVRLLVAGAGPLRAAVESAGASVTYLGPVAHDNVDDVYALAHVTCVPSRTTPRWEEQFGRVVVESLVRGVPVVATSTGALPWLLDTTGGGRLVPQRDPASLASTLGALRDDASFAAALGREGRDGALAAFSTPAVASRLAGVLGRVRTR